MHKKTIFMMLTVASAATALTACADPTTTTSSGSTTAATASSATSYDVSSIPTVDEIAALVPDDVKKRDRRRSATTLISIRHSHR